VWAEEAVRQVEATFNGSLRKSVRKESRELQASTVMTAACSLRMGYHKTLQICHD
jgi:hypothetical protein